VHEFHPRLAGAAGSPAPARFPLTAAQLIIARQYGFASWARLRQSIAVVIRPVASPQELARAFELIGARRAPALEQDRYFLQLARRFPDDRPLMLVAELDGQMIGAGFAFRTPAACRFSPAVTGRRPVATRICPHVSFRSVPAAVYGYRTGGGVSTNGYDPRSSEDADASPSKTSSIVAETSGSPKGSSRSSASAIVTRTPIPTRYSRSVHKRERGAIMAVTKCTQRRSIRPFEGVASPREGYAFGRVSGLAPTSAPGGRSA